MQPLSKSAIFMVLLIAIAVSLASAPPPLSKSFDSSTKTLSILRNSDVVVTVKQESDISGLTTKEEIFNLTFYGWTGVTSYTFNDGYDLSMRWEKYFGKENITDYDLFLQRNISYNLSVNDYGWNNHTEWYNRTVVDNMTNITSWINETILVNELVIIGNHTELRYKLDWIPLLLSGKTINKGQSYVIKVVFYKKAEVGSFSIKTIPSFIYGIEEDRMTWWNTSSLNASHTVVNNPNLTVVKFKIHNSSGTNNATDYFCNGYCNKNFTGINLTRNNATEVPFYLKLNYTQSQNDAVIYVNVSTFTPGDVLNIYHNVGNLSTEVGSASNGTLAFLFFDDFNRADSNDLGSKWAEYGDGNWQISGNRAFRPDVSGNVVDKALAKVGGSLYSVTDTIIESKVNITTHSGSYSHFGIEGRSNTATDSGARSYALTSKWVITTLGILDTNIAWKDSTTITQELNQWWNYQLQIDSNNMRGKAWVVGGAEPSGWMVQGISSTQSSGYVGMVSYGETADTLIGYFDDFILYNKTSPMPSLAGWSATESQPSDTTPPSSITNLQNTTGNFYHNWTWTKPSDADFNLTMIYINGNFITNVSNTTTSYNFTADAHNTSTISTHTVDNSSNINSTWVNHTSIIPNNVPILNSIGNKNADEGTGLNFTISGTDLDSDSLTCATNATKGTLSSCNFNWSIPYDGSGTYYWNFNISDGHGGIDDETITVTVNNIPLNISSFLPASNTTSIQGAEQQFNITLNRTANVTWYMNGTQMQVNQSVTNANYTNNTASIGEWNVTATATDGIDTVSKQWNWTINSANFVNFTFANQSISETQIYQSSQATEIKIDVNDSDGYITNVSVGITYNGFETNYSMAGGNDTWSYNFKSGVAGSYTITHFYATDNASGTNSTTSTLSFVVVPGLTGGTPPTATPTPATPIEELQTKIASTLPQEIETAKSGIEAAQQVINIIERQPFERKAIAMIFLLLAFMYSENMLWDRRTKR